MFEAQGGTTMTPPETAKPRWEGIPLNYFQHSHSLERWKWWLTLAGLAAPLAWFGLGLLRSDEGQLHYLRGPVAAVHATWEADCTACHIPYTLINDDSGLASLLGETHGTDARCQACHAGPPHHTRQNPNHTPSCAGCHCDHRGRDASLVRVPDSACTRCHQDLVAHLNRGEEQAHSFENRITRFDLDHPPFLYRSPFFTRERQEKADDPGRLKFSHQRHLAPGMKLPDGGEIFLIKSIHDPKDRARYRRGSQKDTDPVQLDCASCHQLESRDFGLFSLPEMPKALLPARSAGATMLPITYENQCRACHPLTVERLPAKDAYLQVPHRLQPNELHDYLEAAYSARYLSDHPKLLERTIPKRPLPGKIMGPAEETARKEIQETVAAAEKILFQGEQTCKKCHHEDPPGQFPPERMVPPNIPEVWFEHALFNHAAHRALTCQACHAEAESSTTSAAVLLPGIETCRQCHAPVSKSAGGARHDCVECHRYHHGDRPLEGLGAKARGVEPARRLGIEAFRDR